VTDIKSETEESEGDPSYSYKPGLVSAPLMLWLRRGGLEFRSTYANGFIPYDRIRRVRLMYRPATMQGYRFTTEIWSTGAPKLQVVSTTWGGLALQQRLDASYATFVTELHRRLAAAGSKAQFRRGMASIAFAFGTAVVAAVVFAFLMLMFQAAQLSDWRSSAVIAAIFAVFAWQLGNFFVRNRPGDYRPEAIPPQLLPRA